MVRAPVTKRNVSRALRIIRSSRRTHIHWAQWRRRGNDGDEMAGDLEHHEKAIADYDHVLSVLNRIEADDG